MKYKDLVTSFNRSWNFTRSETLEILEALTDQKLKFKPEGQKWQSVFYQFGCIGRTQMVYTQAIKTGFMDFSLFLSDSLPKKDQYQTLAEIKKFLEKVDRDWVEAVRSERQNEDHKIAWPGFKQPLVVHINSLIAHERLHHGQLVSYFTLAGFELPPKFKTNWAL